MKEVSYKDFIIEALPWQLAESRKWALNIRIWKYRGDQIAVRHFSSPEVFATENDAITHGFAFGQKIIDGKNSQHTVKDL